MSLNAAGPLDVVDVLRTERAAVVELLRSLGSTDWGRPTECPAYDVQGVAAHVLGDDLSLLARQRDGATPGLLRFLGDGVDFAAALDRFNDQWVDAARFFSPAVLIDLLVLSGQWSADWYASVDQELLGEPVGFFGPTVGSPYWQIAAREYVERWVHHHQIRRAVGRADLDEDAILLPAAATVMRATAAHLSDIGAAPGDSVVLSISGLADWTLQRDGDRWTLFDGRPDHATAELTLDRPLATPVMSRGLPADGVVAAFRLGGDRELARRAVTGIAALAGR